MTVTIVIVNKTCSYFCPEFVTVTIVVVNKTCSFCPDFVTVTIVIINNNCTWKINDMALNMKSA